MKQTEVDTANSVILTGFTPLLENLGNLENDTRFSNPGKVLEFDNFIKNPGKL